MIASDMCYTRLEIFISKNYSLAFTLFCFWSSSFALISSRKRTSWNINFFLAVLTIGGCLFEVVSLKSSKSGCNALVLNKVLSGIKRLLIFFQIYIRGRRKIVVVYLNKFRSHGINFILFKLVNYWKIKQLPKHTWWNCLIEKMITSGNDHGLISCIYGTEIHFPRRASSKLQRNVIKGLMTNEGHFSSNDQEMEYHFMLLLSTIIYILT